jgi:MFS family permease
MTQSSNSSTNGRPSGIFSKEMAKVGWQVACATLLIVFLAFFGGNLLDRYLGTKHILMIVLVISAGPLAMYVSYKLALRAIKAAAQAGHPTAPDQVGEEEKVGE